MAAVNADVEMTFDEVLVTLKLEERSRNLWECAPALGDLPQGVRG